MKLRFLTALILGSTLAFGATAAADKVPPPNLAGVISVTHRFGMAHACPITTDLALTNAHVIDPFVLLDAQLPMLALRWNGGYLRPLSASLAEDLAILYRDGDAFSTFFPLADSAPATGEQLWWTGYDWSKPGRALRPQMFTGKVVEVRAGILSLDTETREGSSGGCVLNAQGQLVGVTAWGKQMDNQQGAAFAVSVWGRWFDLARAVAGFEAWRAQEGVK